MGSIVSGTAGPSRQDKLGVSGQISYTLDRTVPCSVALRTTPPGTPPISRPYTLEDLLRGLRFALLPRFDDYHRLVAAARVDVPAMYGAPGI